MPKGRRNSIANRSGSSASGSGISSGSGSGGSSESPDNSAGENTADINEQLRNAGTIQVELESRTRRQMETVQVTFDGEPGTASVSSASGNSYNVDYMNGTCDCQHHRMRSARCRHIEAVDTALGQVINPTAEDTNNSYTMVGCRETLDTVQENARNEIMPDIDQEDDNHFYLDNMDEFNRKIREGVDVPYEYENVLNGNNVTFGIELEFVGGNANAIARELYDQGICAYPERVRYHEASVAGKWKLERDGTVSDGYGGGEIVSPVLKDTPDTWRQIEKICEIAKRHGARIDQRCGGHVHIGMEPLDTARQRWKRFFKVMSGYEECIYRSAGGDSGRIRRDHSRYATPFSQRAEYGANRTIRMDSDRDVAALAAEVSTRDRYYGINLTNIASSNKPDTVEFRYFNGSLNPKQIQANVKLSAGVMMAARKGRTRDIDSISYEVGDSMKRRGKMINNYKQTDERSNKKVAEFLDIIFTRKADKDALLNVFSKNNWR